MFNLPVIRGQFPILDHGVGTYPLIYLDNAATAQKPRAVLEAMQRFYEEDNANVHRGMYGLSERATEAYEGARATVQRFINAARPEEIIFTKSCTEALNLVARAWGGANLRHGDAVILTVLEHHSNIVPWLQLKEERGVELRWIDIDDQRMLRMDQLRDALRDGKAKMVSVTGQSNVLGVRPPLEEIIRLSHDAGALTCLDAAQLCSHHPIDVDALDCDFLAFSGHKLYGPTGIGVLYGKRGHLRSTPPFLGGGMMIQEVRRDSFTPADIPQRFEAGTPPIAEAVGLASAIKWIGQYSWTNIEEHEQQLLTRAAEQLRSIPGLRLLGPYGNVECRMWNTEERDSSPQHSKFNMQHSPSGCLSFIVDDLHPHDLTALLGERGICLRAGHHCTQPLHERLGVPASTRLSVAIYNTLEEIDRVAPAIREIQKKFHP